MPAERRFGMDHEHYDWSPVVNREVLRWPEKARVALCVIVNLEHMEWQAPESAYQAATLSGGAWRLPYPDYIGYSHREYGHRVGIFRVLKALQKYGIPATIAMDSLTAQHYPYLVDYCKERGCEFIGHGVSVSRMITSKMSEGEEREYIREAIDVLTSATGSTPAGWLGPEYGESTRTPQLLAEAGLRYVCDWTNDEQPYPLNSPAGEAYALPIMLELDDVNALWDRRVTIGRYRDMLKEAFDTMYGEAARSGRLLVLNLHPWLIGQPFRIRYLDNALEYITRRQGVWAATGSEIVDWYRAHRPGG